MTLSNQQIAQVIRAIVTDDAVTSLALNNISKADLQATVTAVDTWATNNASSYNTALPEPFKSTANASQKAVLLAYVCLRRAGL